jgi:hypothetical protein
MSADSSRRFLSLAAIYAINQISLFVTFKVSAEIASPVAHVALLAIHSVGSFVSQLADLGYSRPAYRNIAHLESVSAQADYYVRVNLQRALILAVVLPVVVAFTSFGDSATQLTLALGCCYVVGVALRSQWIFASHAFFALARRLEFASGLAMVALMVLIYIDAIGAGGNVILAGLALMRLAPLAILSAAILRKISAWRHAFVLDREIFVESLMSTGMKVALLFAHYSNSIMLLVFFEESQVSDYLHAEKLFYAGLGIFAFAANDIIRLAARGLFRDLPWWWLAGGMFLLAGAAVLVLTQVSGWAVALAFSDAYRSAATPLNWMLLGFPVVATNIVIANAYLFTRSHDRLNLVCAVLSALANVAVVACAVSSGRPNLAAFGVLATEVVGFLVLASGLARGGRLRFVKAPAE